MMFDLAVAATCYLILDPDDLFVAEDDMFVETPTDPPQLPPRWHKVEGDPYGWRPEKHYCRACAENINER